VNFDFSLGGYLDPAKIQLLSALNTPKFTALLLEKAKENGLKILRSCEGRGP